MSLPLLGRPTDSLGRGLDDLRISVIDRCNLRCTFCMPAERSYTFLPRAELLSFEELERLARIFVSIGVRKIRLTGGEPLLRRELEVLVGKLAGIPGVEDLALTTNGILLERQAAALKAAGLRRVTVSLESLDDQVFGRINGRGAQVAPVLRGIAAAEAAGLSPIKINVVVMKGINDGEIPEIARFFKERGHVVRFIEFMDVGTLNQWNLERVVSAQEIRERLAAALPLEPLERQQRSDVAQRYRYRDDGVEVGIITSVTEPFCGDCTRARLTADGELYTCLFAASGLDLKSPLRGGASDDELAALIRGRWQSRDDRYSEARAEALLQGRFTAAPKVEMFRIGG